MKEVFSNVNILNYANIYKTFTDRINMWLNKIWPFQQEATVQST